MATEECIGACNGAMSSTGELSATEGPQVMNNPDAFCQYASQMACPTAESGCVSEMQDLCGDMFML